MQKILFIIISIIIFPIYAFSNTFNKIKYDFIETNTNIINDIVNNEKINGIEKGYYENGNLKSETVFKNGQIVKEQKYDKNGNLK